MENGKWRMDNVAHAHSHLAQPNCQLSIINCQLNNCQFPTAYAPNVSCLSAIARCERFSIDTSEPYVRQTFRNRCEILTSQGVQKLSIPVDKKSTQTGTIKDARIDYADNWQRQHWRSLQAAYNNSPYFLYYQDELQIFYNKPYTFLVDFNTDILRFVLEKMKMDNGQWTMDNVAHAHSDETQTNYQLSIINCQFQCYSQVFNPKKFVPNLSSFDLLFNCGPESKQFLCKA